MDTETHTGRMSCDDRSIDWSDVPTSQGMPRIVKEETIKQKEPEARWQEWRNSTSELPEATNFANALILY